MSVIFNRAHLTKAAEQALAGHEKQKAAYAAAIEVYKAKHAKEATERTRGAAYALREALTKGLRKRGPVTIDELRRSLGGMNRDLRDVFYSPPQNYEIERAVDTPKGFLSPAEITETRALLAVLRAAEGDTISANELKLLGLKNLAPVFVAAGQLAAGR